MRFCRNKKDNNQGPIVDVLRSVGCSVLDLTQHITGTPDLAVARMAQLVCPNCRLSMSFRRTVLMEVKSKTGKLSGPQVRFQEIWKGEVLTVYTPAQALKAFGIEVVSGT